MTIIDQPDLENQAPKQRHGCVTAWLIFIIIASSIAALGYVAFIVNGDLIAAQGLSLPNELLAPLILISLLNVLFAIMLLRWKKWAFWGFGVTALITLGINIAIGISISNSVLGLLGVVLLYGVLQIKQDGISTWEHLE